MQLIADMQRNLFYVGIAASIIYIIYGIVVFIGAIVSPSEETE